MQSALFQGSNGISRLARAAGRGGARRLGAERSYVLQRGRRRGAQRDDEGHGFRVGPSCSWMPPGTSLADHDEHDHQSAWSPWLLRSLPHAVDQARQCQKSWHLQPGVPRSAGPQGGASRRSAANNSEKTLLYRRMAHDSISIKPQPSSLAAFAVSWTIPSSS